MSSRHAHLPFILCLLSSLLILNFIPRFYGPHLLYHGAGNHVKKRALSTDIYILQDNYAGDTFFGNFSFFNSSDPTDGSIQYVDGPTAFSRGLARVEDGVVIMQTDNTTVLPVNGLRPSVRITSNKSYNSGILAILDLTHAPWGCSVWPAYWMVGPNWPTKGEIDIFEGVHDNTHNQMTWHTGPPGCNLTVSSDFTGTATNHTSCVSTPEDNSGCAVIDWSRSSYGPEFDALQGGVYTMTWDDEAIQIWFFYRQSIPADVLAGAPDPSGWGPPASMLTSDNCDISSHFADQQFVFDITTCGDWAGASFATSGCPGECGETVQNPENFVNASWHINYLKVYEKKSLALASSSTQLLPQFLLASSIIIITVLATVI